MKNILVPIDGSQPSRNALQHAIDIANVYNADNPFGPTRHDCKMMSSWLRPMA